MKQFDARKAAFETLNTLDKGRNTLDGLLEKIPSEEIPAARRDRALFQMIVFGVLRWRSRLDFIISRFSTKRIDKIDSRVLNILRLALFQIIYLDRIPNSAAVNTAVEIAKACIAPRVAGYVNAVLRRATREYPSLSFPDIENNAIAATAVAKSFPEWIVHRWINRYGLEVTSSLCDAINTIPPISVRTNTLKTTPQELTEALVKEAEHIKPTPFAPDGITFVNPKTAIAELNTFKKGWFQVQDEAAQMVSILLDPQPGESVLDACAGLGGKTGHIAQLMKNEGSIVALDINEDKLLRLDAEMQRLGISIVKTACRNAEASNLQQHFDQFDRVLLDAPCSGLGIMRRNPDIKWRNSKKNLTKYKTRQLALLERLSALVKPCGYLVYAVCSPEPEENEIVVNEFLKKNTEFVINKQPEGLADKMGSMMAPDGFFKTFPHFNQMDGFAFVRLQRI